MGVATPQKKNSKAVVLSPVPEEPKVSKVRSKPCTPLKDSTQTPTKSPELKKTRTQPASPVPVDQQSTQVAESQVTPGADLADVAMDVEAFGVSYLCIGGFGGQCIYIMCNYKEKHFVVSYFDWCFPFWSSGESGWWKWYKFPMAMARWMAVNPRTTKEFRTAIWL